MTDIEFTCDPEHDDCTDGFRLVDEAYVDKHYPLTRWPHPGLDAEIAGCVMCASVGTCQEHQRQRAENEAHVAWQTSQREGARSTVYPCPVHNPDVFLRWRSGDWPTPKSARRRERERIEAEARLARAAEGLSTKSIGELLPQPNVLPLGDL